MVQVGIYGTTGTFPNLAKDSGDLKYHFWPEPTWKWIYNKVIEYEEIPGFALPFAYDSFVQNRSIQLSGTIKTSESGDPPGARTIKEGMEELDAVGWQIPTFSNQPVVTNVYSSGEGEVLCIEATFPDASTKQQFVIAHSLNFDWGGGLKHLKYTATFREVSEVIVI